MAEEPKSWITIRIGRREAVLLAVVLLVIAVPYWLVSETLTLSTTYPSPAGIYNKLVTTGSGPNNTVLNRDAGYVILAPPSNTGGRVGVGTSSPSATLHVAGGLRLENGTQASGRVLYSDANGVAYWAALPPPPPAPTLQCTNVEYQAVDSPNASVFCPAGYTLVGGGCSSGSVWYGTAQLTQALANTVPSMPGMAGTSPNGWNCHQTDNLGARNAHAYAVCCKVQ